MLIHWTRPKVSRCGYPGPTSYSRAFVDCPVCLLESPAPYSADLTPDQILRAYGARCEHCGDYAFAIAVGRQLDGWAALIVCQYWKESADALDYGRTYYNTAEVAAIMHERASPAGNPNEPEGQN